MGTITCTLWARSAAALLAALAASAVFAAPQASAQSGWEQFAQACRQNGGTPYRAGEGGHDNAWCDFSSGSSGSGSSSSEGQNYGPVVGIIGAVVRAVQNDRNQRRRAAHNRAVALNDQGIAASRNGDYEGAERYYTQALQSWPDNQTIANNLARVSERAALARSQRQQIAATEQALASLTADLNSGRRVRRDGGLEFMDSASRGSTSLDFMAPAAASASSTAAEVESTRVFATELLRTQGAINSQMARLSREMRQIVVPSPDVGRVINDGVIMGMLATPRDAQDLMNNETIPFDDGRRYRCPPGEDASCHASGQSLVLAFGSDDTVAEAFRAVADNLTYGEYTLNTEHGRELVRQLNGTHFNRLIAHSNGATITEALIRSGAITVDELNIVGGDRSLANTNALQELINSGTVRRVRVFLNPGDPIPGISSLPPSWPISRQARYIAGVLNGEGRSGSRVEVCLLQGSVGQNVSLESHYLRESYFPNMRAMSCAE